MWPLEFVSLIPGTEFPEYNNIKKKFFLHRNQLKFSNDRFHS